MKLYTTKLKGVEYSSPQLFCKADSADSARKILVGTEESYRNPGEFNLSDAVVTEITTIQQLLDMVNPNEEIQFIYSHGW